MMSSKAPLRRVAIQSVLTAQDGGVLPERRLLRRWVREALTGQPPGEVTIRIVGLAESQALNARYRDADKPTNVLSFPADAALLELDPDAPLGDVVICAPVLAKEAAEQGKPAAAHWAHLCVHGALHLAGYDHEESAAAEIMEALERKILARLGFGDPYASA